MKKTLKKSIGFIARSYHSIRSIRPVWKFINRKSRNLFTKHIPELSSEQKKILEDLKRDGIAISHIDKLFPKQTFQELEKFAMNRWNDADVKVRYESRNDAFDGEKLKSKSFFLIDLWKGERILDLSNPFVRFSLSNPVLDVINTYMNMFVKFMDWRLQVTVPMPEGMRSFASQEWHRDPEDQQLIKMFLYLNDVDENSGPFIYLKKSHIFGKWRGISPQRPPRGSASDDTKIPVDDKVVCTGKAGTLIFCDTSGLHRGGHAKLNNRFMYTSVYISPAAVWPILFKHPAEKIATEKSSPSAAYAVTNSPKEEPKYYQF